MKKKMYIFFFLLLTSVQLANKENKTISDTFCVGFGSATNWLCIIFLSISVLVSRVKIQESICLDPEICKILNFICKKTQSNIIKLLYIWHKSNKIHLRNYFWDWNSAETASYTLFGKIVLRVNCCKQEISSLLYKTCTADYSYSLMVWWHKWFMAVSVSVSSVIHPDNCFQRPVISSSLHSSKKLSAFVAWHESVFKYHRATPCVMIWAFRFAGKMEERKSCIYWPVWEQTVDVWVPGFQHRSSESPNTGKEWYKCFPNVLALCCSRISGLINKALLLNKREEDKCLQHLV